jgi:hypothetical protein
LAADAAASLVRDATVIWSVVLAATIVVAIESALGSRRVCFVERGLDLVIAAEMRVPLATVCKRLAEVSAAGDVAMCHLTRYEGTKTMEAWRCRVSGYVPAPAAGRKPKAA